MTSKLTRSQIKARNKIYAQRSRKKFSDSGYTLTQLRVKKEHEQALKDFCNHLNDQSTPSEAPETLDNKQNTPTLSKDIPETETPSQEI